MKHFIIINPFDSLVINRSSDEVKKKIFSTPQYCKAALDSFSLANGAGDIINFLKTNNSINVVLVSAYSANITKIVADHFGIKYLNIYHIEHIYKVAYENAMREHQKTKEDTVVLTGHINEVKVAGAMELSSIFFSTSDRAINNLNCTYAENLSGVLSGLGLNPR